MPKKSGKNLIRIALSGAAGRMGREIESVTGEYDGKISARVDAEGGWAKVQARDVDVVIDFSTPAGAVEAAEWSARQQKPLVSGTTGMSTAEFAAFKKACAKIPLLYSANMSPGIAALTVMLKALSALKEWDFQIEETHHKLKKDRPSGTALLLQKVLQKQLGRILPLPNSIRGGNIPGVHQVLAMGPDETLRLEHIAFNRKVFARGALLAARWLIDNKAPGLYDLTDLYNL